MGVFDGYRDGCMGVHVGMGMGKFAHRSIPNFEILNQYHSGYLGPTLPIWPWVSATLFRVTSKREIHHLAYALSNHPLALWATGKPAIRIIKTLVC